MGTTSTVLKPARTKPLPKDGAEPTTADDLMLSGHGNTVLSYLLCEPAAPEEFYDLSRDDFIAPTQKLIFDAIVDVHGAEIHVNFLSVTDRLRAKRQLKQVGGEAWHIELPKLSGGESGREAAQYALDCLRAAGKERQAAKIGEQLHNRQIEPRQAIERLEKLDVSGNGWVDALDVSVVTASDLREMQLRPRRKLLGDWFCEGDLGFIFAFRGVGKTWLALAIAQALSTGGKLGEWQAHEKVKVLYVDGEMPPDLMRDRCEGLQASNDNLQFLNHEILFDRTGKVLNITNREIQQAITQRCIANAVKVLILDNLSTLASGMKENEADSWELVNNWLLDLRRRKIAVVIVHHAGRSGEMRGTSKREDNVFWIIALDDARKNSEDKRGARFISHFTKSSRNTQEEVSAYKWHFITEPSGEVTISHAKAQTLDVFRQIIETGVTKCDHIAAEMKVPNYAVSRMAKKAKDAGWLTTSARAEYVITEAQK